LGGAVAAEGQGAINALVMDENSSGFDRVRSRPAKIHEVLAAAQQAKASAARAEAKAARPGEEFCHAASRLFLLRIPPHLPPTYHFLRRDFAKTCGWNGGEGRGASSALGSDEAGNGSMDKATCAAIARAYEVDRGGGVGESGAREGGKAGARAGRGRGEGGARAGAGG
jgi:hypothetical protein